MIVTTNIALLIFRVAIGLTLAGHGTQKLFGWFGGPGPVRLRQGFEKQGYKPAWFWASLAIVGELGGGLSFAFGFLTPLGGVRHFRRDGYGDQDSLEKRLLFAERRL